MKILKNITERKCLRARVTFCEQSENGRSTVGPGVYAGHFLHNHFMRERQRLTESATEIECCHSLKLEQE